MGATGWGLRRLTSKSKDREIKEILGNVFLFVMEKTK